MTRIITNEDIRTAGRAALANGTLLALHITAGCVYRLVEDDGREYNCGIGAALTPDERTKLQQRDLNMCSVSGLFERENPVDFIQFEDLDFARQVQIAHDRWHEDDGDEFRDIVGA